METLICTYHGMHQLRYWALQVEQLIVFIQVKSRGDAIKGVKDNQPSIEGALGTASRTIALDKSKAEVIRSRVSRTSKEALRARQVAAAIANKMVAWTAQRVVSALTQCRKSVNASNLKNTRRQLTSVVWATHQLCRASIWNHLADRKSVV